MRRPTGLLTRVVASALADVPSLGVEQDVEVRRIEGVPSEIAFAGVTSEDGEIWIAPGTFVTRPRHPLHAAHFGSPRRTRFRGFPDTIPRLVRGDRVTLRVRRCEDSTKPVADVVRLLG